MTRAEFFKQRAMIAFEREHGITRLEPAPVVSTAWTVRPRARGAAKLLGVAARMSKHPTDEKEPQPIRARGTLNGR